MPFKSEKIIIQSTKFDRRRKLTEEQKEEIRNLKGKLSQRKLATKFNVSRRTIQFILDPEKQKQNLLRRKERGGSKIYYNREKNTEAVREHRRYKNELYKEGKIKLKQTK